MIAFKEFQQGDGRSCGDPRRIDETSYSNMLAEVLKHTVRTEGPLSLHDMYSLPAVSFHTGWVLNVLC